MVGFGVWQANLNPGLNGPGTTGHNETRSPRTFFWEMIYNSLETIRPSTQVAGLPLSDAVQSILDGGTAQNKHEKMADRSSES